MFYVEQNQHKFHSSEISTCSLRFELKFLLDDPCLSWFQLYTHLLPLPSLSVVSIYIVSVSVYSLSLIAVCSSPQYLGTLSLTVTLYLLVILRVVHSLAYLFVPVYF